MNPEPLLNSDDITVAITVYSRRRYLKQAISSALAQTVPVRVLVVEDCGPDAGLRDFVMSEFGSRIRYVRNPTRRGLFDNWNACLEQCETPWLSILHDDDYLDPRFAETMLQLRQQRPNAGLYFGHTEMVNEHSEPLRGWSSPRPAEASREVGLQEMVWLTPFPFPGQLFPADLARSLGGFRATSQYCGDWEMWAQLTAARGAVASNVTVAYNRGHSGPERGTSLVYRTGKLFALTFVQRKRILHLLRQAGCEGRFSRRADLARSPFPTRNLLRHARDMRPLLLRYNLRLVHLSRAPSLRYRSFQIVAPLLGPRFLRWVSRWHRRPSP